jgi:hypothetical protein
MAKKKKSTKKGSRPALRRQVVEGKKQIKADHSQPVSKITPLEVSSQKNAGQRKVQVNQKMGQKSVLETFTGENTEQVVQRVKKEMLWGVASVVVSLGIGFLAGNFIKL